MRRHRPRAGREQALTRVPACRIVSDVTTPTGPAARTLVLVRHAKASNDAPSDLERPLTQRGWSMSEELADELRLVIGGADLLLVSPATRAQHTSRPLERRLLPQSTRTEEAIYRRGPTGILSLVCELDDAVRTVVVVGHEPTMSILAHMLHDTDDALASQVSFGVPTATALILQVPTSWAQLGPRGAHLSQVITAAR